MPNVKREHSSTCRECGDDAPVFDRPFPDDNLCWDCLRLLQNTDELLDSIPEEDGE